MRTETLTANIRLPASAARIDAHEKAAESIEPSTLALRDHLELHTAVESPAVKLEGVARLEQLLRAKETQSAPSPSSNVFGSGWSTQVAPHGEPASLFHTQRGALEQLQKLHGSLGTVRDAYHDWKLKNPAAPEPTDGQYTMGQIVDGDLSDAEQCLRLLMLLIHERPQTVNEMTSAAPSVASMPAMPSSPAMTSTPSTPAASSANASNPLGGLLQTLGPICQVVGPVAQILGGVLASPIGGMLLGGAAAAVGAVFPPALALVPIAATVAPIAGAVLLGVGGVASGVGNLARNEQPGAPGSAPAATPAAPAPAAGLPPDLGGAISGLTSMLNALGPVANAVGPAIGAAATIAV